MLTYENSPSYADLATAWTSWGATTFIQLTGGASPEALQNKFGGFIKNYYGDLINTWQILGWMAKEEGALKLKLQPLAAIHLQPDVQNSMLPASNPTYAYILGGIGLIVLLIARINFTTLAMAAPPAARRKSACENTGRFRSQLVNNFGVKPCFSAFWPCSWALHLPKRFCPSSIRWPTARCPSAILKAGTCSASSRDWPCSPDSLPAIIRRFFCRAFSQLKP
jgi:hypothetical protein